MHYKLKEVEEGGQGTGRVDDHVSEEKIEEGEGSDEGREDDDSIPSISICILYDSILIRTYQQ